MLGTGARIGESLAVLWSQVDLDAATVDITDTIARIKGEGLIRKLAKSNASQRQVGLPNWLIATHATATDMHEPTFEQTMQDVLEAVLEDPGVERSAHEAMRQEPRRCHPSRQSCPSP
jgi:hypothetical protein